MHVSKVPIVRRLAITATYTVILRMAACSSQSVGLVRDGSPLSTTFISE